MNQTGFLGSWRWGASHTMGVERKMLKDNLKRLLNHPGLPIFTSPLHMWCSWKMLPTTEGDAGRGCRRAGEALGCCQHNDGGNKAPGWDPSPCPPGAGASLNYLYMDALMLTKGLLMPPAHRSTRRQHLFYTAKGSEGRGHVGMQLLTGRAPESSPAADGTWGAAQ